MAYNQITFAQIRSQLLIRLSDPSGVFWSNTSNGSGFNECSGYITEAMQTWSALTGYWRDRAAINPAQGFIDTQILMNGAGESLCPRTTTDARILAAMEFNLLEPATPSSYSGSEMFTQQALLQALQNRRDQFLLGTGITINRSTQITNLSRPVLDPSIIAVRRADWNSSLLYPVDEFELAAFLPTWSSSPGTPQGYSTIASPPLTLQLAPPPANAGTLGLLTINSGPAITGMGVPLGIPNDWGWAIKWGALADLLLAPGPAYDPQRAQYCESRFQGALQIAQLMPQIIQAQLSSLPLPVMALFDLDQTLPSWQSATGPSLVLGVSQNLFVLAPFTANQGLTLDLVRTALLPVLDGDFLQIGPEELDAILGYAIHLASFKLAGGEFTATQPLLDAFNQAAVRYNRILAAESTYLAIMKGESTREASVRPYIAKE